MEHSPSTSDPLFAILDEGRLAQEQARLEQPAALSPAALWLAAPALARALGWELKPQGLCRAAVCLPVAAQHDLVSGGAVNVLALAERLGRPVALDGAERALYVGAAARERSGRLASLEAPDFSLPDLGGAPTTLAQFRGRKVLLAVYASW